MQRPYYSEEPSFILYSTRLHAHSFSVDCRFDGPSRGSFSRKADSHSPRLASTDSRGVEQEAPAFCGSRRDPEYLHIVTGYAFTVNTRAYFINN